MVRPPCLCQYADDVFSAEGMGRKSKVYRHALITEILIAADSPAQVASNAWLKLCRLDVNDEIERWARTREQSDIAKLNVSAKVFS